jgi:hypothetical protein
VNRKGSEIVPLPVSFLKFSKESNKESNIDRPNKNAERAVSLKGTASAVPQVLCS